MESFAQLHDGFMDGILIAGTEVTVFLRTCQNETFTLKLADVVRLNLDGFNEGNIIFDVNVRQTNELTLRDMNELFGFNDEGKAAIKLEQVKLDGLIVTEINPSYGASFLALASSASLTARLS